MNTLFRAFLAINATSWVVVVYGIKEEWTITLLPSCVFSVILLLAPIFLSWISVWLTRFLSKDSLEDCAELEDANNSFLPTYLAYFFVGLGIEKVQHLIFIYSIILAFTYVAHVRYFNPIFLLFGYRFYNAKTKAGTKIFIISKTIFRNANEVQFSDLRRINDTTYISLSKK